jgi:hypothetical protein
LNEAALDQFPPRLLHPFVCQQSNVENRRVCGRIAKWRHRAQGAQASHSSIRLRRNHVRRMFSDSIGILLCGDKKKGKKKDKAISKNTY